MSETRQIKPVPWDKAAFGFDCFEIADPHPELLKKALTTTGHYTVKVDPLADKSSLHEYGFYYCDTLIEPWCTADQLKDFARAGVSCSTERAAWRRSSKSVTTRFFTGAFTATSISTRSRPTPVMRTG